MAAKNSPSLVSAFPSGPDTNLYREVAYRGSVLNLFPHLWWSYIMDENWTSRERERLGESEFRSRLESALEDRDFRECPDLYTLLQYLEQNPMLVDIILNDTDNEFYAERSPHVRLDDIKCLVYLSAVWKGTHTEPIYAAHQEIDADGLKTTLTPPKKFERPYHEYTGEMLRWYDHLMKGEDNGIDKEPPVKMYVSGAEHWRFEEDVVLDRTEWREYYLRSHDRLLPDPKSHSTVEPSSFVQEPLTVDADIATMMFRTPPMSEPTEMTGPVALSLYASIDAADTTLMACLYDIGPDERRKTLGRGLPPRLSPCDRRVALGPLRSLLPI